MSEHTGTPWQIGITLYPYVHFYGPADKNGFCIAIGSCVTAFGKENDEANAAFICKAVNSHDTLVTELKLIADWRNVSLAGEYEHSLRDIIRSMLDCADRALASIKDPS